MPTACIYDCCSLTFLISLCCFIFQKFLRANCGFYGCALAAEGDIHHHHEPLTCVSLRAGAGTRKSSAARTEEAFPADVGGCVEAHSDIFLMKPLIGSSDDRF